MSDRAKFSRLRFGLRFLVLFAALAAAFARFDVPARYGTAVVRAASLTTPALTGWWLEPAPPHQRLRWRYRHAGSALPLQIDPAALGLSLLPLLSLLLATPATAVLCHASRTAAGVALLFLLDVAILTAYPVLVGHPGPLTDIAGTFLGLLGFVAAPAVLWFGLTHRELRDLWRLDPAPSRLSPQK